MADTYVIAIEGLDVSEDIALLPEKINLAQQQAINKTIDRARTAAAREIRKQVAFPASYLTGADSRLNVTQRAGQGNMMAVITGRFRATSLARFSKDTDQAKVRRAKGVNVQVKPGGATFIKGAFLVHLRAGSEKTDTKFNLGVAIRLKKGQKLTGSTAAVKLEDNVWLLYGPSVNQVFKDVADEIAPDTADYLQTEFTRLLDLELSK